MSKKLHRCLKLMLLFKVLCIFPLITAQQDFYQQNQYSTPTSNYDPNNPNPSYNDPFNSNVNLNNLDNNDRTRYRTDNNNNNFNDLNQDFGKRPIATYGGDNEPSLTRGKTSYNVKTQFLESYHSKEPTYFIVASRMVRPGLIYQVAVNILQAQYPTTVHASISCDGVQISGESKDVKEGVPETLLMRIPPTSVIGEYKLRVEGFYQNVFGGLAFLNETRLDFSQRSMTIFIQTDKPLYMQGETVRFRSIPITTELKGFDNAIDVYMLDPNRHIVRRWLSRYVYYLKIKMINIFTLRVVSSVRPKSNFGQILKVQAKPRPNFLIFFLIRINFC